MSVQQNLAFRVEALTYRDLRSDIRTQMLQGQYAAALSTLLELQAQFPVDLDLLDDMATCYWSLGDEKTAIDLMRIVAERLKTDATAWCKLGSMHFELGRQDKALMFLNRALRYAPTHLPALSLLQRLKPIAPGSVRAKAVRALVEGGDLAPGEAALAHNLLGQIADKARDYATAMRHFEQSKILAEGPFVPDDLMAKVAAQEDRFEPPGVPDADRWQPVFVVGLPRSGTTLVESILCQHSEVDSVGETPALSLCQGALMQRFGRGDPWGWLEVPNLAELRTELQSIYFAHCKVGPQYPVFIDKTPRNIFDVGLALTIFPRARVIFMSRHPLAVGVSNMMTHFQASQPFSRDFAAIGAMTRLVHRSAEDYRAKLGDRFRWQSFAHLVTDPKEQIAAMLDHLGLGWQAACLHPERREGAVHTASFAQVRAAINPRAVDQWARYAPYLTPLVAALGGQDWIDDWQAKDAARQ